ncbi:hypothetical protein ACFOWM_07125 [Ferruginibacter yonginensis]|uniref:Cell division protein ZipA n=1 Tax=Ferruginibacter yonginensis TaxID=1310416 RepID=A0ABV8QSB6_9BACT
MKTQSIVIGLIATVVILYFIWTKFKNQKHQTDTDTSKQSTELLPTQEKQNDKLVIVKNVSYTDLQTILTGFCNMYNKERYQARPRLTKITESEFAITFPFDIDFIIFCYFINYVHYPMDFDKTFYVTGWTTTKSGDNWITEKSANKKVMLFIPSDDTDHDNVYMTTIDSIGFKLGFAIGEEKQMLNEPKKKFSSPTIDILELTNLVHKDFK